MSTQPVTYPAPLSDLIPALARAMAVLHPGWDVPGIATALTEAKMKLRCTPQELATAAIEFARRDDLTTPALFPHDGPHWHTGRTPNVRVKREPCPTHVGQVLGECRDCVAEQYGADDVPVASPEETAALRARIAGRTKGTKV